MKKTSVCLLCWIVIASCLTCRSEEQRDLGGQFYTNISELIACAWSDDEDSQVLIQLRETEESMHKALGDLEKIYDSYNVLSKQDKEHIDIIVSIVAARTRLKLLSDREHQLVEAMVSTRAKKEREIRPPLFDSLEQLLLSLGKAKRIHVDGVISRLIMPNGDVVEVKLPMVIDDVDKIDSMKTLIERADFSFSKSATDSIRGGTAFMTDLSILVRVDGVGSFSLFADQYLGLSEQVILSSSIYGPRRKKKSIAPDLKRILLGIEVGARGGVPQESTIALPLTQTNTPTD
jgi:hypothetical protein